MFFLYHLSIKHFRPQLLFHISLRLSPHIFRLLVLFLSRQYLMREFFYFIVLTSFCSFGTSLFFYQFDIIIKFPVLILEIEASFFEAERVVNLNVTNNFSIFGFSLNTWFERTFPFFLGKDTVRVLINNSVELRPLLE